MCLLFWTHEPALARFAHWLRSALQLALRAAPMAWTAERKRARRAELVAARAADDAARGIKRRPRGPVPVNHHWDECAQIYVLDAPVPHTAQPADVPPDRFAWAVAHPPMV